MDTEQSLGKFVTIYQSTRLIRELNLEYEKYRTVSKLEKICALLDCYEVGSGSLLPKFRDNLSVPSTGVKNLWQTLNMGQTDFPETSVRDYHYSLRNDVEERTSRLLRGGSLKSRILSKLNSRISASR